MQKGEVASLVNLLDDSDSEIVSVAMSRLCAKGESIIPDLEQAWQECFEKPQLARIEHVIEQIQSSATLQKLKEWVDTGAAELLPGACYMAKLLHPDAACEPMAQAVDNICRDIWIEFNSYLTALEKVTIINKVLFGKYQFCNNASQPDNDPKLFLIDNLLQSKMGNGVALSTLYLCVAEKLKLPIKGLDITRSIMLAYLDEYYDDNRSLFYIYPFFRGQVLGKQQLEMIVNRSRITEAQQHKYLNTCNNQKHILSLAETLQHVFAHAGQREAARKVKAAVKILSRGATPPTQG
ncbi:MAG: transglutaminase-like domain-containing protein [Prevotellaceae bacterium]|jgi:regulator of sirC expression with transglutaminase-like and TPR domain|nr:transglutaminase-like domain-containing protein [Prevotellaceae bacterium]